MSESELKTICAFDIGIKNLSYCVISQDDKTRILEWELIDIHNPKPGCTAKNKNGKICGKNATLYSPSDESIFYCAAHSKIYDNEIINNLTSKIIYTTEPHKCTYSGHTKPCARSAICTFGTDSYCNIHESIFRNRFIRANKLKKIHKTGCMKDPIYDLGRRMYDILDTKYTILNSDKIIIENQPSLTNPTMKSISILLLSFFIARKYANIEFIAPSNKLKVNEILTNAILSKCPNKTIKYAITKELGIKYTIKILEGIDDSQALHDKLMSSRKKDDLCDAFLHAYYHINKERQNNIVTGINSREFSDEIIKYFNDKLVKK